MHRFAAFVAALLSAALLAPAVAGADVKLTDIVARPIAADAACQPGTPGPPADAAAGGHRDLCVAFNIQDSGAQTGDDLKDLTLHLAPGLLGDPNAAAKCTQEQFDADACPAESQVGTVANSVVVAGLLPTDLSGQVYNLAPPPGAPALLGIRIDGGPGAPPIRLLTKIAIRTTDYGLDSVTQEIPRRGSLLGLTDADIQITKMALTLWGPNDAPGRSMAKPFITLPTSCAPATDSVEATGYDGPGTGGVDSFTPTACDQQPYDPKFSATLGTPGATGAGAHVQVDTLITQTAGEANTAKTVVTLPAGFGANPAALKRACPQDQLLAGTCPASAKVGSVSAHSPVLPFDLDGDILVVQPKTGLLPELSLELPLGIRLRATVGFAPGGRLQTIFPVIPDVPLDRLRVVLVGEPDGMLMAAKDLCTGPRPTIDTEFTSHGGAVRTASTAVTIPCPPTRKLSAKARLAGVKKHKPTLGLNVSASGATLRQVRVTLPTQLRAASRKALRGRARIVADGKTLGRSALRASGRTLVVALPSAGARAVRLTLRAGALRPHGRLKAGRRLTFKVQGVPVSGAALRTRATAKAAR